MNFPRFLDRSSFVVISLAGCVILVTLSSSTRSADDRDDPDKKVAETLFQERVLPAMKQHCYECHSAKSEELKGNLRVDTRMGLRKGGDNGPAVVPGDERASFLLKALSYKLDDYKMPPRGKLDDELLADFERW